jgi:hypothetical protein
VFASANLARFGTPNHPTWIKAGLAEFHTGRKRQLYHQTGQAVERIA